MQKDTGAFETPDWTQDEPYVYTERFNGPQWAWEYLRRNAEFRADWKHDQLEFGLSGYDPPTTMVVSLADAPRLSRWGCLYATAPDQDAVTASVFWNPQLCSSVLQLTAQPSSSRIDATPFVLGDIPCPSVLLELPNGPQHLLFHDESRRLQLVVDGADVTKPVRLMTDGAPDKEVAGAQLRSLHCFNDLRLSGRLYDSHFRRTPMPQRLRLLLRVLDGERTGASQEEIAQKIFADDYAAGQWHAPGQPLRDRVRRALYRGHAMTRGGYRELLS